MAFDWTNLIAQVPIVASFVFFVLKMQDTTSKNVTTQHEYWQTWLTQRDEEAKRERDEWREFIKQRDQQSRIERKELLQTLKRMDLQLENLSNFTLLVYMEVAKDKGSIVETLKDLTQAQKDG